MQCKVLLKITQCYLMFVLTKNIFSYSFVMHALLTRNQVNKTINCVTLCFRNTEMYSGNYVASWQRK